MRLIDADVLIERTEILEDVFVANWTTEKVQRLISAAPTIDAVPVVRCKDCKYCSQNTPDGLHWCEENEIGSLMDDDFCSYGERRAND